MSSPAAASPGQPVPQADAGDPRLYEHMFDLAPVSLWLEDFSAVRELFAQWRAQGVADVRAFLREDPARVAECTRRLKVLRVNHRTLELFGAESQDQLVASLGEIFRDDMFDAHVEELGQLWDGSTRWASTTVNYTLGGERLDIQLDASILPGHEAAWDRVLLAIEDVTERSNAQRRLALAQQYAQGLFEHSPVSLWVEDFSVVKELIDGVRASGITDFRTFTDVHPEFVERCMQEIRVIDVNQQTLATFAAPDKATLLRSLDRVFRDDMQGHFTEQLIDLWNGKLFQQRETVNYALNDETVHVYLQFSVLPGHDHDWSLVLVSLTDITARKKAEAYLEFLGKHDALTKLRNRSYFLDELSRIERKGPWPVSVVVLDLNGLKMVNDENGHAAGDALLRRAGEVLGKVSDKPSCVCRIGGDEFAVLMPGADERAAEHLLARLHELVELNNQFYGEPKLNFSVGSVTTRGGERLESVVHRADQQMYEMKKAFYANALHERRKR